MTTETPASRELEVRIQRSASSARDVFFLPFMRPILVLDLLHWIQGYLDSTLAYSYSCRSARCGTCSVQVNGRPVLACQERIECRKGKVSIEPLHGFPVIRDLVVDMQPFIVRWRKVQPFQGSAALQRDGFALISPQSPERKVIDPARGCIKCGACYSSCGMSGKGHTFLGPAVLNRALILIADSRDQAPEARLQTVLSSDGVDGCHYHGSCSRVCPRGLDPAAAITRLRRRRFGGSL